MAGFLAKKCIPEGSNPKSTLSRARCGTISGITGILLNIMLSFSKLMAGYLTGSIAVMADAANNLTDAVSSAVSLICFRMAVRKADRRHPFGHGRIEYLCGMSVSVLIIITGAKLAQQSAARILFPEETLLGGLSCAVLVISILVKLILCRFNSSLASLTGLGTLHSVARDAFSDALSTSAVLISLLIHHFTGLYVDGFCGLAVAVFILVSGFMSLRETSEPLLGGEPDPELIAEIAQYVKATDGVLGIHDPVIHDYGLGQGMMTLHIEIDADSTLIAAHTLADRLERELSEKYGLKTVIHIDPSDRKSRQARALRKGLEGFLPSLDASIFFHDLQLSHDETGSVIVCFDLDLPYGCSITDDQAIHKTSAYLASVDRSIVPVIGIDHYDPSMLKE